MLKKIKDYIYDKYDWSVYWMFYSSMNRICRKNVGFAYLMVLFLNDFIEKSGITPELKRSTEEFFESVKGK